VDARKELETAWREWRSKPVPSVASDDDEIDELLLDLIEYDAWVAGLVSHIVGGVRPPQEITPDPELCARIAEREADDDPRVAADARSLSEYLKDLERLIAAARQVAL
jgi:hypothetical protein